MYQCKRYDHRLAPSEMWVEFGKVCVYTKAAAHVIVDVQAALTTAHTVGLVPINPLRVHDSR